MNYFLHTLVILFVITNLLFAQQPEDKQPQETPQKKEEQPKEKQKPEEKYKITKPTSIYEVGRVERDDLVTVYYRIGHQRGEQLKPFLEKYLTPQKGYILFNEPLHLLAICDTKENIRLIEKVMNLLDVPSIPIYMSITVVETTITSDLELGLEATYETQSKRILFRSFGEAFNPREYLQSELSGSLPFQGSTVSFMTDNVRDVLDFKLRTFLQRGAAKIHTKPNIIVNSGGEATIEWGEKFYLQNITVTGATQTISFTPQDVNSKLIIKPHVIGKDFLDLNLNARVSQVISFQNIQGVPVPIISFRDTKTSVTIRSGDKVIIGGIIKESKSSTVRGVPLLMDIPIIGYLFKRTEDSEDKTEITFIIEAYIVPETGPKSHRLVIPGEE